MLHPRDGSFCCLGVLTDIYLREKGLEWTKDHYGDFEFNGHGCLLPTDVMVWAELDSDDAWEGRFPGKGAEASLAVQNDAGRTFEEIAQVIEREL